MDTNLKQDGLDGDAICEAQESCAAQVRERFDLVERHFEQLEMLLRSLQFPQEIDRLVGESMKDGLADQAQSASPLTRWLPGRWYRWLVRRLAAPLVNPYLQAVELNVQLRLRETVRDLYTLLDLRYRYLQQLVDRPEANGERLVWQSELSELQSQLRAMQNRLKRLENREPTQSQAGRDSAADGDK